MSQYRGLRPFQRRSFRYGTVQHWMRFRSLIVPSDLLPHLLENMLRQGRATIRKRFLRGYYDRPARLRLPGREPSPRVEIDLYHDELGVIDWLVRRAA